MRILGFDPFSRLFASLRTLVVYGSGMAGKEGEAATEWLDQVFDQLRALTDQAIAVTAAAAPPADVAEAEKRARAVGVLARTAKAVAALKPPVAGKTRHRQEDAMSEDDRDLTDAELDGLQAEFLARVDHLVAAFERKSLADGMGREPAEGAEGASPEGGDQGDAEVERRPGLAA